MQSQWWSRCKCCTVFVRALAQASFVFSLFINIFSFLLYSLSSFKWSSSHDGQFGGVDVVGHQSDLFFNWAPGQFFIDCDSLRGLWRSLIPWMDSPWPELCSRLRFIQLSQWVMKFELDEDWVSDSEVNIIYYNLIMIEKDLTKGGHRLDSECTHAFSSSLIFVTCSASLTLSHSLLQLDKSIMLLFTF